MAHASSSDLPTARDEQEALRRVATLVALGTSEAELFTTVTEEVCRLLDADQAQLNRFEPDGSVTVVATWACRGEPIPLGRSWTPAEVEATSLAQRIRAHRSAGADR